MGDVTRILEQIESGDAAAAAELLPQVYDELRRLAAAKLASEPAGQTLQATALVHEAYLKLVGRDSADHWNGRAHFFAAAAEAMRRILVEQARRRNSLKRGGGLNVVEFDESQIVVPEISDRVLAVDEALEKLQGTDPKAAELVKLKYFGGMTLREAAQHLGIASRTADEIWAYSRAWLFREISRDSE